MKPTHTITTIFIKPFYYMYYSILYFFLRLAFIMGLYDPPKIEGFLDADNKYILPIKTKFLEQLDNISSTTIDFNQNIDPIFYDKKEFTELMKESNNYLEKIWRTRILFEKTSRGNIIMFYDPYKLGFSFFCDHKIISYDILNAAAMKYSTFFRCLDFFVDENINPKSSPFIKIHFTEEPKKKENTVENNISKNEKNPFAKLKNYAKESNPNEKMMKQPLKNNNTSFFSYFQKDTKKETNGEPEKKEPEKMKNKFMYLGKINNFNITQPIPKKRKVLAKFVSPLLENIKLDANVQRECIKYSDFKKQLNKYQEELLPEGSPAAQTESN